jgi:hypothetical protein
VGLGYVRDEDPTQPRSATGAAITRTGPGTGRAPAV